MVESLSPSPLAPRLPVYQTLPGQPDTTSNWRRRRANGWRGANRWVGGLRDREGFALSWGAEWFARSSLPAQKRPGGRLKNAPQRNLGFAWGVAIRILGRRDLEAWRLRTTNLDLVPIYRHVPCTCLFPEGCGSGRETDTGPSLPLLIFYERGVL